MAKEPKEEKDEAENEEQQPEEDYREKFLRLAAEFDNYKKRMKREIDDSQMIGKAMLMKQMLPILDEFELAVLAVNGSKNDVAKGIEMLYSNFIDALKREGLSEVKCDGKFDPSIHDIIMVKDSNKEDGMILEVAKKGYVLEGRLIRPASIIVSRKIEDTEGKEPIINDQ